MAGPRVLLVDDNQIFGSQVEAAFSDAGIAALCVARGSEVLSLLRDAANRPQLIIIDLVRPASAGSWLLGRLYGDEPVDYRPPLALVLVPVIGTFSDLPEGVEVQVKPIFPTQVVATARRLMGLAPATGRATAPSLPTLAAPATGPAAVHRLPPPSMSISPPVSGRPPLVDSLSDHPTEAHIPHPALDQFEDSSDFGPADTLLAPSNIEELARAMTSGNAMALQMSPQRMEDELFDGAIDLTADAAEETTSPRAALPPRKEPAIEIVPAAVAETEDTKAESGETEPLIRTMLLPRGAEAGAYGALSGDLSVVPLIDIIAMLSRQRQRGVLYITGTKPEPGVSEPRVTIYWRDGRIELCTGSNLPPADGELRIGRFILEAAALSHAQIDEVEERRRARPKPDELLGTRLLQEGLLQREELRQALSRQSAELLFAALRLSRGRFQLDHHAPLPRHVTARELGGGLDLDAEALLLEGYRRIHDYHLLNQDAEEGAVYVATAGASGADPARQLGLSDSELVVLGLCNGRMSLAEIAKDSRLSLLEVARTVQRLQALKLCRRRLPALLAS